MIIYMTTLTYASGRKKVRFSGRKSQYAALAREVRCSSYRGLKRVTLERLDVNASDFTILAIEDCA